MKTYNITNSNVTYAGKEIRFAYAMMKDGSYEIHSDDPGFREIIGTDGFTYEGRGTAPYVQVNGNIHHYLTGTALQFGEIIYSIIISAKTSKMP